MKLKINRHILRMECQDLMPAPPPLSTQTQYAVPERVELFWKHANLFISQRNPNMSELTRMQIKWLSFKRALLCQILMQRVYSDAFYNVLSESKKDEIAEWDNIMNNTWKGVERILSNHIGKKTVDKYWNRMKLTYGSDHRFTDQEVFDALSN